MSEVIHGKNVTLSVDFSGVGDFSDPLCATDVMFRSTIEFVEKTGPASGINREFMPRLGEWNASVSGLTDNDNSNAVSFFYCLQTAVRRAKHDIRITYENELGGFVSITGEAYFGDMEAVANVSDFVNCTIQLKGTGGVAQTTLDPPVPGTVEILSDWWPTVNGLNYVAVGAVASSVYGFTLTSSDEILETDMEGTEHELVNPPVNRDYFFNTGSLRVIFPNTFDGTQRVFIEFKRTT